MKRVGGQRPIFPILAVLFWRDDGRYSFSDDAVSFRSIAEAMDHHQNETATRGSQRAAGIRKAKPYRTGQNEVYRTKRRVTRRKRG